MDAKLESFIITVGKNASNIDDIGKKAIRNLPVCRELKKKYNNIDDLVNEIYAKFEPKTILEKWASEYWSVRRLNLAHTCRGEMHLDEAFSMRARLQETYPIFYKRLKFKYTDSAISRMIFNIITDNPWSEADVVEAGDVRQSLNREKSFYDAIRNSEKDVISSCRDSKPMRKDKRNMREREHE